MKPLRLLLAILFLFTSTPFALAQSDKEDEGEWYPFYFPEKLDPDSPLNIGKLVLDAPAGKHGFVKVKDGHFYFEDGTRAKFWGTNLCFSACFPTHAQAEMLAERIAYFGFNAVRLHHMDSAFEPRGIFEDVCPTYKDPQRKKTGVLSKKQLDRLDYLIFQLKKRGVYIDMNLLVSRHFTEADGVKNAAELGMAAKPVSMFDPTLIKLQKQYAHDLLTHYNPYTKLRYCDEPAIALIEICNENSIRRKINSIPKYYRATLQALLKNWLITTPNNRIEDLDNFYSSLEKSYFNEMLAFLKNVIGIKIPVTGSQYSNILSQQNCDFIDKHTYWDHPQFPYKKWDKYNFTIHNKSMLSDQQLGMAKIFREKQKAPEKPWTLTEWNACYPNTFAYEAPPLMAQKALEADWDALFQFAFSHGEFELDNIKSYFDIIANPQQLILCAEGSLYFLKGKIANFPVVAVKNSGSGWINGKFTWGKGPTLLKKLLPKDQPKK